MKSENQDNQNNFSLYILLGAIRGAITGAGAGYLLSRRIEEGEDALPLIVLQAERIE